MKINGHCKAYFQVGLLKMFLSVDNYLSVLSYTTKLFLRKLQGKKAQMYKIKHLEDICTSHSIAANFLGLPHLQHLCN